MITGATFNADTSLSADPIVTFACKKFFWPCVYGNVPLLRNLAHALNVSGFVVLRIETQETSGSKGTAVPP
jgi:hypothetical protein